MPWLQEQQALNRKGRSSRSAAAFAEIQHQKLMLTLESQASHSLILEEPHTTLAA